MRRALSIILVSSLLACSKAGPPPTTPGAAGGKPAPAPAASTAPPRPSKTEAVGDGFFMDVPKWRPEQAKGLTAKYKWGSADERTTTAMDGGSYWRLSFPDRPKPSDVARVQLRFEFELTAQDRETITKSIEQLIQTSIDVVVAAAKKTGGTLSDRIAAESSAIVTAAKPLAAYVTNDGTPGDEVVLKGLGFKRRSDGGLELADPTALVNLAKLETSADVAGARADVNEAAQRLPAAPNPPTPCSKAIADMQKDMTNAEQARAACANAILEDVKQRRAAADKAVKAAKPPVPPNLIAAAAAAKALEGHAEKVAAAANAEGPEPAAVKPDRVALEDNADIESSYAFRAYKYARLAMVLGEAEEAHGAPRTALRAELKSRIEVLEQDQLGSVILAASGEKRTYDVSTGVVYVGGLEDVVVPIMIAACPLGGGCLRRGETVVTGGLRSISADLGIRAQTLDKPDPRGRDALSFLLGASINPIYFLRISAGFYTFENAQSAKWNVTGYVGTTVNILQAAELFGVVGLGTPAAPKVVDE